MVDKKYAVYVDTDFFSFGSFWTNKFLGFFDYDDAKKRAEYYANLGYSVKLLQVVETCEVENPKPALTWNKV